jgi:hypothetical protein
MPYIGMFKIFISGGAGILGFEVTTRTHQDGGYYTYKLSYWTHQLDTWTFVASRPVTCLYPECWPLYRHPTGFALGTKRNDETFHLHGALINVLGDDCGNVSNVVLCIHVIRVEKSF